MSDRDLKARLEAVLARASGEVTPSRDSRQDAFLRAAAVLWRFAPEHLQPDAELPARDSEAAERLQDVIVRVRGKANDGGWTLRDSLRPELLRGLDAAALARLRGLYGGPVGPEQALVDRWLSGWDANLAQYGLEQLAVVSRMRTWFAAPPEWFPREEELGRLRGMARFREPLEELVGRRRAHDVDPIEEGGGAFCGRKRELEQLRAFVYETPPSPEPALLVIHGAGGVGKSTLTAKFLLDTLESGDRSHLLAYLDFDLPTLDINDGVSLVLDIASQSAVQRPDAPALKEIADRAAQATVDLGVGNGRAPGRALVVRASMLELADALGAAARAAGVSRVTMVFDTFEEIQYANADHQRFLQEQLTALHARLPNLRTLLVSRARLALPGVQYLELEELDEEAARAYLASRRIEDPVQIEAALAVSQRNPLSLKLACDVLKKAGELTGLAKARDMLQQEMIQGQLYRRILQHVHDREVQQLAHPGLVVRRVTPEIIQLVLAEPCDLGTLDEEHARSLFDRLAREISLVQVAEDGALEHRRDVRRVMLKLLYRDRPVLARDIHERAARYYEARGDDISIAEAAYHRLALGETEGPWLTRLTPGAAARLRGALEELPEHTWPVLASYVGIDLPPERWSAAKDADRERRIATRLRDLLTKDRVEEAVALLTENPPKGANSVLWRWQGRAFAQIGRLSEALPALKRALATLAGPPEEAQEDARLAAEVAQKLVRQTVGILDFDTELFRFKLPSQAVPVTYSTSTPLELDVEPMDGAVHLLDDQELRQLVKIAIDTPGEGVSGAPVLTRSTRAAQVYAEVVKLNQTPTRRDGTVPLLEWTKKIPGQSHETLSDLKVSLGSWKGWGKL